MCDDISDIPVSLFCEKVNQETMKKLFTIYTLLILLVLSSASPVLAQKNTPNLRPLEVEKTTAIVLGNNTGNSGVQNETLKHTPTIKTLTDSVKKVFEITKYTIESEKLKVWMVNSDNIPSVDVVCYNILGKKVKDIGHLVLDANEYENNPYECYVNDIPNGIYIISFQGSNVRAAIKITISR